MFPPPRRVYRDDLGFEEDGGNYRLVGAWDHVYAPEQIVGDFEKLKGGLSATDLARAREAAVEARRSGEEMEDAQALAARIEI